MMETSSQQKLKETNEIVKIGAGVCASINIPEKFVILVSLIITFEVW